MRKILLMAAMLALVGVGCLAKEPQPQQPAAVMPTTGGSETTTPEPPGPDKDNPISYDFGELSVSVEKAISRVSRIFKTANMAALAEGCGAEFDSERFNEALASIEEPRVLQYSFLFRGDAPNPTIYSLTVIGNGPKYTTLEEFEKDFAPCPDADTLIPLALNDYWLVFEDACGVPESGCELMRDAITETLELN